MSKFPLIPLPYDERMAKRCDFVAQVEFSDLTDGTTSEAQLLSFDVAAKMGVEVAYAALDIPFQNASSTANNSTTLIVGDTTNGSNSLLTSMELNANGSYVPLKEGTGTKNIYTATTTTDMTFTPKTGTKLTDLTAGRVRVYFRLKDERPVAPPRIVLTT